MRYILASASPRRKVLLKKIIKTFRVIPSAVDERRIKAKTPATLAVKAALAKALAVALTHQKDIVIGADTIVILKNKVLGKPKDNKDAIRMLKSLGGRTHKVITGLAIVERAKKKIVTAYETTKVKMKKIADQAIKDYVASGRPLDKAGGYGIQEIEDVFIDRIAGERDNVVGLPLKLLKSLLRRFS